MAHSALLAEGEALRKAHVPHGLLGVFTFFTPSFDYLPQKKRLGEISPEPICKKARLGHLTTLKEKLYRLTSLGVDFVCLCHFHHIQALSAQDFLELLAHDLGAMGVVCGFNFRFGAGGAGDAAKLSAFFTSPRGDRFCAIVPPFCMDGGTVSSTRIRQMLLAGHPEDAIRHMGRPYALESRVIHGKHLGRSWGFPTANQNFPSEVLVPAHGVYAVLCHTPKGIFPGVANIGSHPTVDDTAPVNCETHIMGGFAGDLYGQTVKVEFLHRLRGEMKFDSEEALRSAISKDRETAASYISAYLARKNPKAQT